MRVTATVEYIDGCRSERALWAPGDLRPALGGNVHPVQRGQGAPLLGRLCGACRMRVSGGIKLGAGKATASKTATASKGNGFRLSTRVITCPSFQTRVVPVGQCGSEAGAHR